MKVRLRSCRAFRIGLSSTTLTFSQTNRKVRYD